MKSLLLFMLALSQISVMQRACIRCPSNSTTTWLVAENFLASTSCLFASLSFSHRSIWWTSCHKIWYDTRVAFFEVFIATRIIPRGTVKEAAFFCLACDLEESNMGC